jgi:hypothetical protein
MSDVPGKEDTTGYFAQLSMNWEKGRALRIRALPYNARSKGSYFGEESTIGIRPTEVPFQFNSWNLKSKLVDIFLCLKTEIPILRLWIPSVDPQFVQGPLKRDSVICVPIV